MVSSKERVGDLSGEAVSQEGGGEDPVVGGEADPLDLPRLCCFIVQLSEWKMRQVSISGDRIIVERSGLGQLSE